jgi:hypothetical protein
MALTADPNALGRSLGRAAVTDFAISLVLREVTERLPPCTRARVAGHWITGAFAAASAGQSAIRAGLFAFTGLTSPELGGFFWGTAGYLYFGAQTAAATALSQEQFAESDFHGSCRVDVP